MKSISNYITESFKISKDIKSELSTQKLSHEQKLEYLNKIFPVEKNKEMWENCKFIKFNESKELGRNYDKFLYCSIVKFLDDFCLEVIDYYTERSYYGSFQDSKPTVIARINGSPCNSEFISTIKNDKMIDFNFNTPGRMDEADSDILYTPLKDIAKKENKVKSIEELGVEDIVSSDFKKYFNN